MSIYLLIIILFFSITSLESQVMWEMIDNEITVPAPNNKTSEFSISKSLVIEKTIYSLNTNGKFSIIKSENRALSWDSCLYSQINETNQSPRFYNLVSNNNSLFVLGDNGKVYKSFDKGKTWDYSYLGDTENHPIQHLKFVDNNIGFVGRLDSNLFAKTTDGGNTWIPLPKLPNTLPKYFSLLNFVVKDDNTIIAVLKVGKEFLFVRTFNGGINWEVFESELFEDTEYASQDYSQMIYLEPYTFVQSGYKDGKDGHTRIMRSIDFEKWEPAFISDTIGGGKRIKSFQIYDDIMFGYGEQILLISKDQGNTWIDLYNEDDEFYSNGNSDGFTYIDNYGYAQSNVKYTDPEGMIRTMRKMFRYKFDFQTSVESVIKNLNVYPNPAKTEININYDKPINSIEILDLNGRKVFESNSLNPSYEKQINVEFLNTGTYFIRINEKIYKRMIKE